MALAEPAHGDVAVQGTRVCVDPRLDGSLSSDVALDWDEGFLLLGAPGCE